VSFFKQDWIERQIEEVARLLRALIKALEARDDAKADQLTEDATQALIGMPFRTILAMDPRQIAALLASPGKVLALARLVATDAERQRERGSADALARAVRAQLFFEIAREQGAPAAECDEAIATLSRLFDPDSPGKGAK
jgi:hypothetical protein